MIRTIVILAWFILNLFLKLDSKYSFAAGMFILLISFIANLFEYVGFGLRATTYAYGFFAVGTVMYFKELYKHERSKK